MRVSTMAVMAKRARSCGWPPPSYAVAIVMLLMIAMPCVPHWSQREYATRHKRLRKRAASYCRSHCEAVADRSNLLAQNRKTSSAKS